jgi:hypothetical protein
MMAEGERRGLPPVLDFLEPGRRDALKRDYEMRIARGEDEVAVIADLALQYAIAPSFVRIVLAGR